MSTIADYKLHGFDVSSYQPAAPNFRINGRAFAIFKATEGTGYFDPHFAANRAAAHQQGCLAIGMYHFAHPGNNPVSDAQWFLSHVGSPQQGEFAVLDYETSPWSEAWQIAWIQTVQKAGWKVVLYTYQGMLASNPTGQVVTTGCGLWVAGYSSTAPGSDRWPHWDFWQHTDGQYGSSDGPWDCSVFYSTDPNVLATYGHQTLPGNVVVVPATPTPPQGEEPVGAFTLPVLKPGDSYTWRIPPADHTGGIPFGLIFVSFAADFGDASIRADAPVPLRLAKWNSKTQAWEVPYGGGSYDPTGKWVEDNPAFPPLYVPTVGNCLAIRLTGDYQKLSLVHCGKKGSIVPTVEYQAG